MFEETAFHPATLTAARPVTDELVEVVLEPGPAFHRGHTAPGQYVQLRLDGREGHTAFFAICSAPGGGEGLELLVKRGGAIADRILGAPLGITVEISDPLGRGFRVDDWEGHDLLLFATGSGISALRPVVHHLVKRRERFGRVVLFFGARTARGFAYLDELPRWERERIEIHRVVSRPGTDEVWDGPVGYVQHVLERLQPDLSKAVALISGVRGMHDAVGEALRAGGLPAERILTNF